MSDFTEGVSAGSTADTGVQVNPGQTTDGDRVEGITDEMIETAADTITQEWFDELSTREMARIVLESALAGRTVVDLPEPDEIDENIALSGRSPILANSWVVDRWSAYAWVEDGAARVDIVTGPEDGTADHAERCGVMLIAAAREARRLAAEQSSGVGGDTR